MRIVVDPLTCSALKLRMDAQVLSIRPDIVGNELSDELQKLQDAVPVFPTEIARQLIEEDLGQTVDEIFSEFSEEPIAAASLAQVQLAAQSSESGLPS